MQPLCGGQVLTLESKKLYCPKSRPDPMIYQAWLQDLEAKADLYYKRGRALFDLNRNQEALDSLNEIFNNKDRYQAWLRKPGKAKKMIFCYKQVSKKVNKEQRR